MGPRADPDPVVERFRREALPRLVEALNPSLVWLFGSRARGDAFPWSDLDLIVVSERFRDVRFPLRASIVDHAVDLGWPNDLLCYTRAELRRKAREWGTTVPNALEEGRALHGSWPPGRRRGR